MSKYTVSIGKLIDNNFDFQLNEYPIFDEDYREILNKNILDYYFMYEIGFETPALFRHYLKTTMNLIMPKYNIMYRAQIEVANNPIGNIDLTETNRRNVDNSGTSLSNTTDSNKNLFQDTPQGNLKNTSIENQEWATNLTLNQGNSNGSTSSQSTTVEEYTKHILGGNGRKYNIEVYEELNESFKSIDQNIIMELEDLFMGVL